MKTPFLILLFVFITSLTPSAFSHEHVDQLLDDNESVSFASIDRASCKKATAAQKAEVQKGYVKLDRFLQKCYDTAGSRKWCDQVARPNPDSYSSFACTYGSGTPHYFIHPTEKTWNYAIEAVKLVIELEKKGVKVDLIYNWWRPEPYNANVGGAAGRHPYGTSVDVRFVSKAEQNKAHALLCQYRKKGRLRALGYYAGTGLHLGVGDTNPNTWGKACN